MTNHYFFVKFIVNWKEKFMKKYVCIGITSFNLITLESYLATFVFID